MRVLKASHGAVGTIPYVTGNQPGLALFLRESLCRKGLNPLLPEASTPTFILGSRVAIDEEQLPKDLLILSDFPASAH